MITQTGALDAITSMNGFVFCVRACIPQSDQQPDFDAWLQTFDFASKMQAGSNWWLGDLIEYGEAAYGEKYAQAEDLTHLQYGTLANIARVCRRFPPLLREIDISLSHYAVVCSIKDDAEAARLLRMAQINDWSEYDLRDYRAGRMNQDGNRRSRIKATVEIQRITSGGVILVLPPDQLDEENYALVLNMIGTNADIVITGDFPE